MFHSSYFKVFYAIKREHFCQLCRVFCFFSDHGYMNSNLILNKNKNILKGKNASTAFANITQVDHTKKDYKKSKETIGLKKIFLNFPCFKTK
jgi:hypothetical protein